MSDGKIDRDSMRLRNEDHSFVSHDEPLPVAPSGADPLDSANSTKTPLNQGTLTVFTADSGTDTLTSVAHGLSDGDRVVLTTDGTLPDELEADLVYFVINKTDDTFQLAADEDAVSVVDFLDNGTGTHEFAVPDTFTGPWTRLNTHTDLFMFAFANVPLGEFEVQWSNDGITKRSGLLSTSDLKTAENAETPGFYIYLDTLTTDIDNYYRVVASGSTQTSVLTEIDTWVYPGGFHGTYLGLNDALSNLSTALLARAVISAERDDGTFGNVGATRQGNLKNAIAEFADSAQHSSAAVPATPFKTVPTEVPQDFYRVRFDRNNLDEVLNQTESSGDYDIGRIGVLGQFKTNGSGGALAIGRTNDHLEYDPSHGYTMDFTQVVATDNAEADSYYFTGALSATNGFGVGRAADALNPTREFGLLHRRGGVDEFIPQSKWNIDKCDGSEGSGFFTRNATTGEKEVIELTPQNGRVWSIVSGYLGFSSTAFFVKPPGAIHYVLVHVLPHDDPDTSLTDPDLPGACEVYEGAASGNPMDIRSGSWRGGSYRAREESHYTSAGSRTGSLAANTEFVGHGTEVKGFDQVDVVILADEASADSGIRFQGQNRDDEWFDITPKFKHGGLAGTSRVNDAGTKGVRAFQIAVGGVDRFRVKYLQGPVTGDVDIFTIAVPRITLTTIHRLGDSTTADRSVLVNKSALIAAVADADLNLDSESGDFVPVGQTSDGGLIVANPWREIFSDNWEASSDLPSGSLPSFDAVGPIVAANVKDTGWLNANRFKDHFALSIFNVPGVKVFFMNASDDQGNNSATKDFSAPNATSSADQPIVIGAPFFDKWFRIVIINDSGADATGWSVRSMGADAPPGGLFQSLDQPIFGFYPAHLNQTVLKAQSELVSTLFEAIKSDGAGRLLINSGSDFSRILQKNVENDQDIKVDFEVTSKVDDSVTDGATTISTTTISSPGGQFKAWHRGAKITGTGIAPATYITEVTDANTAIIDTAATATGSGLTFTLESNASWVGRCTQGAFDGDADHDIVMILDSKTFNTTVLRYQTGIAWNDRSDGSLWL